jgi:hypothetical protein
VNSFYRLLDEDAAVARRAAASMTFAFRQVIGEALRANTRVPQHPRETTSSRLLALDNQSEIFIDYIYFAIRRRWLV